MGKSKMVQVPRLWLERLVALGANLDRKNKFLSCTTLDPERIRGQEGTSRLIGFISSAEELLK